MPPAAQTGPSSRIAHDLRESILQGHLAPGAKLPAVRDLADQYSVSRNTAAKAISTLRMEGLITTRYGSGAYVSEGMAGDEVSADRSIYQRIANDLRGRIESGDLPPGTVLPSERGLIERYETSKTTVAKAIAVLRAEGLIESHRGRDIRVRRVSTSTEETTDTFARRLDAITEDLAELKAGQVEIRDLLARVVARLEGVGS